MRTIFVSPSVMREFQHSVDPGLRVPFNVSIGGCTVWGDEDEATLIVDRRLPGFRWFDVESPYPPFHMHMTVQLAPEKS